MFHIIIRKKMWHKLHCIALHKCMDMACIAGNRILVYAYYCQIATRAKRKIQYHINSIVYFPHIFQCLMLHHALILFSVFFRASIMLEIFFLFFKIRSIRRYKNWSTYPKMFFTHVMFMDLCIFGTSIRYF